MAGRHETQAAREAAPERVASVVTDFFDALERGDREGAEELMSETFDRAFEFASGVTFVVEGRTHLGVAGMRRYIDEVLDAFDIAYENRELRAVGDSVVVFLADVVAKGHSSGASVTKEIGYLFRHRDGLITRGASYPSRELALAQAEEAAGD